MRKTVATLSALAVFSLLCCAPAHAVSKEMIQLQTQVQQLQDAVSQLQRSQDAQLAVMQQVLKTVSDNVTHVNATVTTLQNQVQAQNEAGGGKIDQLSTQMQGINDSVDELRSRVDSLKSQLQAIQSQLQNINTQPAQQQTAVPGQPGQPGATDQPQQPVAPPQPQAPPVKQLYQGAMSDYEGARYDLANSEFGDVLKYYPQDDLAGNAEFYLGEIAFRQGKFAIAINDYETVLQQFPGSSKAPASQLRKGEAELQVNEREAGIRDLRALVARYPQSPEAAQARSKLNGMGVRVTPRPGAGRP